MPTVHWGIITCLPINDTTHPVETSQDSDTANFMILPALRQLQVCFTLTIVVRGSDQYLYTMNMIIRCYWKLQRWCLLLQTVARYQCTRYLKQLVSPALLSATRIVQTCVRNSQMIRQFACIFKQSLLLQSEESSCSILVPQAFKNPCASQLWVTVAAHSSSRGEIGENTDPTNAFDNRTWIIQ